jgi:hypothetical protein
MGFVELVAFLAIDHGAQRAGDRRGPAGPAGAGRRARRRRRQPAAAGRSSCTWSGWARRSWSTARIADRIGRRPTLLIGLAIYGLAGLASAVAPSFERAASPRASCRAWAPARRGSSPCRSRAIATAAARWRSVMSLVTMVFMVVPVLAPSAGPGGAVGRELAVDLRRARGGRRGGRHLGRAAPRPSPWRRRTAGRCRRGPWRAGSARSSPPAPPRCR